MGTGTDPAEGAALARAILEDLVGRGALCIVTSHLGALKTLDAAGSGIVNASLQFDPDRMEPTYRLVKGRPGRSYGLAIARRLGLPPALLDRAEGHLSAGEVSMEELLETLSDLRAAGCDIATVGQYLQPYEKRLPVERYYTPDEFATIRERAEAMGFFRVESGPLVRSSYHARRAFTETAPASPAA